MPKLLLALAACALVAAFTGSLAAAPPAVSAVPAGVSPAPQPVWLASNLVTCHTFCSGGGSFQFVTWVTTESECCSGTDAPCPPGSTEGSSSFQPNGSGFARRCA
jgi:hypothetical protein